MKKMLFISTSYPSSLGGVRRLSNGMAYFAREFDVHFIWINLLGKKPASSIQVLKSAKFIEIKPQGTVIDMFSLLLAPACWGNAMKIAAIASKIQEYIDANDVDCVLIHTIDASFALRNLRARVKIADVVDSVADYYLSKYRKYRSLVSFLAALEQGVAYRVVERILGQHFDLLVFVSEEERKASALRITRTAISDLRDPPIKKRFLGARHLEAVMFGNWQHPPNRDGLAEFLPSARKISGMVKIIGPGLDNISLPQNVHYKGFVYDVAATLSASKTCIIPVWYGAGLQNKVFDAMRHGCKIISTPFTKRAFAANGFKSVSIFSAVDLASAADKAIARWSQNDAKEAYSTYAKFYHMSLVKQGKFARKVKELLAKREHQRP